MVACLPTSVVSFSAVSQFVHIPPPNSIDTSCIVASYDSNFVKGYLILEDTDLRYKFLKRLIYREYTIYKYMCQISYRRKPVIFFLYYDIQ